MTEQAEQAVLVVPGLTREERLGVVRCAQVVNDRILHDEAINAAINGLLAYLQRAWQQSLITSKMHLTSDFAAREDERIRGIMAGIDDAASQLLTPDRLVSLITLLQEKEETGHGRD